jgi:ribosome biogenesis GTPase A
MSLHICLYFQKSIRLSKAFQPYGKPTLHFHQSSINYIRDQEDDPYIKSDKSNAISWYPGHIAKAERELTDYLGKVDVVVEVRDARIPLSTTHPKVLEWIGKKPVIVVMLRIDQVSSTALNAWKRYYQRNNPHILPANFNLQDHQAAKIFYINGKLGTNVPALKQEILRAGHAVNERRERKGIAPRAVRAAVIGFPNVGKSALINRLLGRTMAKSRDLPGVTKALTWVRLGNANVASASGQAIEQSTNLQGNIIELLDSPGIIPAKQLNQENAIKLAICNDIGEAAYDRVVVAAEMCNYLNQLYRQTGKQIVDMHKIENRYKLDFSKMTGDEIVYQIAETSCQGNTLSAADKLLSDFRKNMFTYASLEFPVGVSLSSMKPRSRTQMPKESSSSTTEIKREELLPLTATAKKRVLSKAKVMNTEFDQKALDEDISALDIGRGNFDGW